ncbi:MAG: S9 family peptidase [Verrucomicrobia bacterium]|nr:S9 family peptidase [Verrucomicrobiota bacterium]
MNIEKLMRCRIFSLVQFSIVHLALIPGQVEGKDIDLEYIHQKKELGIDPVYAFLPAGATWSPEGHEILFRQPTRDTGELLVWMHPGTPETGRVWTPEALQKTLLAAAAVKRGESVDCPPTHMWDEVVVDKPDLSGGNKRSKSDDTEDPANPRVSIRWHESKNLIRVQWKKDQGWLEPGAGRLTWAEPEKFVKSDRGENDSVSPNGSYLAYTRAGDIWVSDLASGAEVPLTRDGGRDGIINGVFPWVYWEELMWRSTYQAFEWSPLSQRIAYFQFDESAIDKYPITDFSSAAPKTMFMSYPKAGHRNPSVRVGIVGLSSRETQWVDLPQLHEYLIHLVWAPDGKALYLQGLNRAQNHLCLYRIDPVDGRGELILEERASTWVDTFRMPLILDGPLHPGEFLWLSERTGFSHFFKVNPENGQQVPVTQGEWEVSRRGFSNKSVIYNAHQDQVFFSGRDQGPLEKHYYKASLTDYSLQRLTHEAGNHNVSPSHDGEYFLDTWSSIDVPRRMVLFDRDGRHVTTLGEVSQADFAPYEVRVPELVEISNGDGLVFHASILKPGNFDSTRKYPLVAYVYGEPAGQVVSHSFVSDWDMVLSNHGFVVFRFDGRGTPGRGRPWLDPIHRDQMTVPMQDWTMAVEYLKKIDYIDTTRLGVWGWSGGGTMTLNLMLRTPGLFRAGAAVAAVTDKALYDTIYTERYLGLPADNPDGYRLSSPLSAAADLQGALLVAHGISDDNVHIQNAYNLVTALNEANKPYELYLYPQQDHGIGGDKNRYHLYSRLLEFFTLHLNP